MGPLFPDVVEFRTAARSSLEALRMFDPSLFASLTGFALVSSITPGPNNLMLMSSAALFGWRRTLPHVSGVLVGFAILMATAVYGLGALVARWPWLVTIVKVGGAAWLTWMAWQYFRTAVRISSRLRYPDEVRSSRPLRFHEGLLFQWANPKALLLAVSSAAAYVGLAESVHVRAVLIVGVFFFVGGPCVVTWMAAGDVIRRLLATGRYAAAINGLMGALLLGTAVIVVLA